jgi:hypothetical protein
LKSTAGGGNQTGHKVFTKLDIISRNQLARLPPSHPRTFQIGDRGVGQRRL